MRPRVNSAVVVLLLVALMAAPTTSQAGYEGKGGFLDTQYDGSGKVGTRFVQWLWWRYYEVGSVPYVVYAVCERHDEEGRPVGNNKITFSKIVLQGVESNTEVSFPKRSTRLQDGLQPEVVTWDASRLRTIAHENAVIGSGYVKVKGKIGAKDVLHCELGTAEITGP